MIPFNELPIKTVQNKRTGMEAIRLTEEPYAGIIYTYGKVSFDEDNDNDKATIKFDYEIIDYAGKQLSDTVPFEKYIGDILVELIHHGIAENNLTYTGGIDENRTEDSE